ncbi:MAG: hypothetical protein M3Q29_26175, partial [Chloroflexota bacterium]|nr:hypothetical protein [Chloroflexota bacterium]
MLDDRSGRTTHQVDTPFKNPWGEAGEIEVTDPAHPLFGRRFSLLSMSTQIGTPGHVFVSYRQDMVLRIEVSATSLSPSNPHSRTKLTSQAVHELVALARECEVICTSQEASGADCPQKSEDR